MANARTPSPGSAGWRESDDPDYAAQLARILDEDGNAAEADRWRARAEKRYDELVSAIPPLSLTMPPSSGARRVATHSGGRAREAQS